jgi:hypothetical protein
MLGVLHIHRRGVSWLQHIDHQTSPDAWRLYGLAFEGYVVRDITYMPPFVFHVRYGMLSCRLDQAFCQFGLQL